MKGDYSKTYWCSKGRHQDKIVILEELIPTSGECSDNTPALEALRVAINLYHDVYNNGGWNFPAQIRDQFDLPVPYINPEDEEGDALYRDIAELPDSMIRQIEKVMDKLTLAAFKEHQKTATKEDLA